MTVSDPLGREVPAAVLLVERDGRRTAYVEAAQASGLHLLGADERDPGLTSIVGVGQLLAAARRAGRHAGIVVGVGGSATNDGGAGMLAALGARRGGSSGAARGAAPSLGLADDALPGLADGRAALAGSRDRASPRDDDVPLLGFQGTSAVEAPRKGATPEQAQALEARPRPVHRRGAALPAAGRRCSAGCRAGSTARPGAGAAGGLGYGLLRSARAGCGGVAAVLRGAASAPARGRSDLVVTGAGGSTGAPCAGRWSPGWPPPPRDRRARRCSSRGSASSGGARR